MAPAGDPAQASAAGIDKPGNAWSVNDGLSGCALRDSTNFDARTLFQPPPAGVPPAAARYCPCGRRKTIATAPNPSPEQTENLGPVRSAKDSRLRSQQHCILRDWEGMFATWCSRQFFNRGWTATGSRFQLPPDAAFSCPGAWPPGVRVGGFRLFPVPRCCCLWAENNVTFNFGAAWPGRRPRGIDIY